MSDSREKILLTLLNHPKANINDLAEAANINAISVRHHLSNLQADNLIRAEEEQHGIGRPRLVYSLTEKGIEQFPTSYLKLAHRLLDQIRASLPDATIKKLFDKIASDIVHDHQESVKLLSMNERLDLIQTLLFDEGFIIEWEKLPDQYVIHEMSCPYHHIGQNHPEVCSIDQAVITKIMGVSVERIKCILRGDEHCTYSIPIDRIG
ncbi:MAG: winged helix-turn-helix transcriptional regulator [Anaerolineaceae bacterium]|nr:winged helix-turn-helix transcriptional regulator [Anaerolineaceae bacterium]